MTTRRIIAALMALSVAPGCSDDTTASGTAGGGGTALGGAGGVGGETTSLVTTGGGMMMNELPPVFTVDGIVVDQDGAPVDGATVLQGGRSDEPTLTTGVDGTFSLEIQYPGYGTPGVVAGKEGYRMGGNQFTEVPTEPLLLTLYRVNAPDNPAYVFGEPGTGQLDPNTNFCGHCHEQFARDFDQSVHRGSAKNPHVQDLYAGVASAITDAGACASAGGTWQAGLDPGTVDAIDKCYLGGGVLGELNTTCGGVAQTACDDPSIAPGDAPVAFGACADCHAPGIHGVAGGRNLHDAVDVAFESGVSCDVCHKVRDVDLTQPPGVAGRLMLQRPNEPSPSPLSLFRPVMYGPLRDVPNSFMGAVYQPKFNEAEFCAGCHQQKQAALVPGESLDAGRWPDGLDVHSTYQEWLDGPYPQADTPCQHCHMPPHFDQLSSIGTATLENQSITFGYARPPEDNRAHTFRGPLFDDGEETRLVDRALFGDVSLELQGATLTATVSLANVGCGHAVPTGEPMRALVMLVTAEGTGCGPLAASDGMTVYDVGGAHARGVEGADVSTTGATLTWAAGATVAQSGMVVRVVRPTATFDDYDGVGIFAGNALSPAEKGLEIQRPVGQAAVVSAGTGVVTLDAALAVQAGDVLYLGDADATPADGDGARAFAGAAGYAFARVLVDSSGARHVPHYRAVDMASDNRIRPGDNQTSWHRFDVTGCTDVTVTATVLYRPRPLAQAALRGWDAKDYVIASAVESLPVP